MMVHDDNNRGGSSRSIPSFPRKLYEMVDDHLTDSIISWSESGNSFIVWNESELCSDILPRYHQGNLLSNLIIKLGIYGFRKVESGQFEYANNDFVRGKPELADEIWKRYLASLTPEVFEFKRAAEAARYNEIARAMRMATKDKALTKNLSNLTL